LFTGQQLAVVNGFTGFFVEQVVVDPASKARHDAGAAAGVAVAHAYFRARKHEVGLAIGGGEMRFYAREAGAYVAGAGLPSGE